MDAEAQSPPSPRRGSERPLAEATIRISLLQRVKSYLEPVTLRQSTSPLGIHLDLLLVRNQLMLITEGALYSSGKRYLPAVTLAKLLGDGLRDVKTVLVLGAGIGSIVRVLRSRACAPCFTLVERDRTVLRWAMETLVDAARPHQLEPVAEDAEAFMAENQRKFDLVFVDLFVGRRVPHFVTTPHFLRRCRNSLAPGGRIALNFLADDEQKWSRQHESLLGIFPGAQVASARDNRIFLSAPMAARTGMLQPANEAEL
jgi:predicted membrane-bound spermidine synthase